LNIKMTYFLYLQLPPIDSFTYADDAPLYLIMIKAASYQAADNYTNLYTKTSEIRLSSTLLTLNIIPLNSTSGCSSVAGIRPN